MSDTFASFEQTLDDLVIPEPSVLFPSDVNFDNHRLSASAKTAHKKTKSIVLPLEKVKIKTLKSNKKELKIKK